MNAAQYLFDQDNEQIIAYRLYFRGVSRLFKSKARALEVIDDIFLKNHAVEIYEFTLEKIDCAREPGLEVLKSYNLY